MQAGETLTINHTHKVFRLSSVTQMRNLEFIVWSGDERVVDIDGTVITAVNSGRVRIGSRFDGRFYNHRDERVEGRMGMSPIIEIIVVNKQTMTPIKTADELKSISDNTAGHFILKADIDLLGINWIPIGSFSGMLVNPHGFVINNLTINSAKNLVAGNWGVVRAGLFDRLNGAFIYGVVLEDVFIDVSDAEGPSFAGGIGVSLWNGSYIVNNRVEGFIAATYSVGGIAHICNGDNTLRGNHFRGTLKQQARTPDTGYGAGGIMGFMTIRPQNNDGFGGILPSISRNSHGIFDSHVKAVIMASSHAGGIIGFNSNLGLPINSTFEGSLYGGISQGIMIGNPCPITGDKR